MLRNYLLVALRNMMRNKMVSVIHVVGLGLGIAAFLFSVQKVNFEYSFDNFHAEADQIFSVAGLYRDADGGIMNFMSASPALYYGVKEELPEALYVSRYIRQDLREPYCVVTYKSHEGTEVSYNEPNARYVDEDFLRIFSFPVIKGSPDGQLGNTSSIVMTRSLARKYFGNDDPIGKIIEVRTGGPETRKTIFTYQVTAVLEDIPDNSSLPFDLLLPYRNFEENYVQDLKNNWLWPGFFTFIKAKQAETAESFGQKIDDLLPKDLRENLTKTGRSITFTALPFNEIHFASGYWDSKTNCIRTADRTYTTIFGLIGVSILIVAGVNYINLTTARSMKRAREVGIRKVVGAYRWQLARQFLLDAFVVNALGYALALTLLQLASPAIAYWAGYHVEVFEWPESPFITGFAILIISTLLSGLLPAVMLTSFEPAKALKGILTSSARAALLRKSLVIFQFIVSVSLVVFTTAIFLQVKHLQSKDRGFDGAQRVVIKSIGTEDYDLSRYHRFRKILEEDTRVIGVTGSLAVPGVPYLNALMVSIPERPDDKFRLCHNTVSYNFAKTMGLKVLAGREFTEDRMTGEKVAMLNESAVRRCGYTSNEEAIGKTITFLWQGKEGPMDLRIIGVLGDFSYVSPQEPIRPEIFLFENTAWPFGALSYYTVHIAGGDTNETVAFLKKQWHETFDHSPFDYSFLDQNFQRVFEQDEKTQAIAGVSTLLSILIACMGLGGLVSFTVGQRVKEIGIRKVLGASVSRILFMLSSDFIRLILISVLLAMPLAWVAVSQFLMRYEYRIVLSVWMFLVPCIVLLLITVLTISFQTMKAATSNPVEALKCE